MWPNPRPTSSRQEAKTIVDLVIRQINALIVNATPRTTWLFIQVETAEGLRGYGEATLVGFEGLVLASLALLTPRFIGQPAHEIERLCQVQPGLPGGLAHAAAFSGIEQALGTSIGQALSAPVYQLLAGGRPPRVTERPALRHWCSTGRARSRRSGQRAGPRRKGG